MAARTLTDEGRIAALRRVYDGWGQGDFRAGADLFDKHAVLIMDPSLPDGDEAFVGRDGFRTYMARFLGAWKSLTISATAFEAVGDTIVADCRQRATGLESGVPVQLAYRQLWTFRGPKIIRLETIVSEADVRQAVGLEP